MIEFLAQLSADSHSAGLSNSLHLGGILTLIFVKSQAWYRMTSPTYDVMRDPILGRPGTRLLVLSILPLFYIEGSAI